MSATYVALLGFLGGTAFTSDPLLALLVSLGIGTGITLVTGLLGRVAPGARPATASV